MDGEYRIRQQETNLGDIVVDSACWYANELGQSCDTAIYNSPNIRTTIGPGDITMQNCLDVLPYGNDLIIAEVSGSERFGLGYKVSFDSCGGSYVAPKLAFVNKPLDKVDDPKKENYRFNGWFTDKEYSTQWNFKNPVSKEITLYAKWTEQQPEPPVPPSPTKDDSLANHNSANPATADFNYVLIGFILLALAMSSSYIIKRKIF